MSEPITTNIGLIVPNTGDLVNAWGTAAINVNMSALDGILGGFATMTFSVATTVALTLPTSGALTPSSGPVQSQNSCIKLTGTLSGNAIIQLGMPGRYVFDNRCIVGTNYVQLAPASGGGNACGVPPGKKTAFFYDGTNVDFIDLPPEIGALENVFLASPSSGLPSWIGACTIPPFLNINDSTEQGPAGVKTFNSATYPVLFNLLGTTALPNSVILEAGQAYFWGGGIATMIRAG